MRSMRIALTAVVALVLALVAQPVAAGQKAQKKKEGTFVGTVVEVKKEADKNEGTIVVKGQAGKNAKKAAKAGAAPADKTFKITGQTKFATLSGKKGNIQETPAKLADIEKDKQVVLTLKGDTVEDVKIQSKKKKKAG